MIVQTTSRLVGSVSSIKRDRTRAKLQRYQVAVSEYQIHTSMLEGLEHVSDLIARYAWVETLYLHASTPERAQLQAALIGLYVAILKYLAKTRRYYSKPTHGKTYCESSANPT